MSVSINNPISSYLTADTVRNDSRTNKLSSTIKNTDISNASDEELMDVCKSFEAYFIEQAFKEMKKTVHSDEDDNEYMQYFGDMMIQSYAEDASEGQGIGIAQLLYDSMKRQ